MKHKKYKHRIKTDYECRRDLLIPKAERYADHIAGPEPFPSAICYRGWIGLWNREFHLKMNELAKELLG